MIRKAISKRAAFTWSGISVALLLLLYTAISYNISKTNPSNKSLPTWSQLGHGVVYLFEQPDMEGTDEADLLAALMGEQAVQEQEEPGFLEERIIWEASKATLSRLLVGLTWGIVGGVLLGMLMGCFLSFDAFASPHFLFASRIIVTAVMPIFFKVSGIGFEMFVTVIAFGSMPFIALSVANHVKAYPANLIYLSYTRGASSMETILKLFGGIAPKIINDVILCLGVALVYLIAAEQLVAGEGFGYRIRILTKATRFDVVYPLVVILTVYLAVLTAGLRFIQNKYCRWYNLGGSK